MKLQTDDEIFRAKLVYLGPPGYTLPVHLTFGQIGLFAVVVTTVTVVALAVFGSLKVIGFSIAAAMFLSYWICQQVNYDVPARLVVKAMLRDCKPLPGPTAAQRVPSLTARHITYRTEILEEANTGE